MLTSFSIISIIILKIRIVMQPKNPYATKKYPRIGSSGFLLDYWIHFSCARDSFTYSQNCKSLVFEEVNKQEWYDLYENED